MATKSRPTTHTTTVYCPAACTRGDQRCGAVVEAVVEAPKAHTLKSGRTRTAGTISIRPCPSLLAQGWDAEFSEVLWDTEETRARLWCGTCGDTLDHCPAV